MNLSALGLLSLGGASLAGYRLAMPKSVAGVRSPGTVAAKALALASLLCVGTFSAALGSLAAYLDVRSVTEFSALARDRAPGALRALGVEPRRVAAAPEEEAAWQALDDRMKQGWEDGDWNSLSEAARESFSKYFDDRPTGAGGGGDTAGK